MNQTHNETHGAGSGDNDMVKDMVKNNSRQNAGSSLSQKNLTKLFVYASIDQRLMQFNLN